MQCQTGCSQHGHLPLCSAKDGVASTGMSEACATKRANMSQRRLLLAMPRSCPVPAATCSSVPLAQREAPCSHWRPTMLTTRQALLGQDVSCGSAVAAEPGAGPVRGAAWGWPCAGCCLGPAQARRPGCTPASQCQPRTHCPDVLLLEQSLSMLIRCHLAGMPGLLLTCEPAVCCLLHKTACLQGCLPNQGPMCTLSGLENACVS